MNAKGFILVRWMVSFALLSLCVCFVSSLLMIWYKQIVTLHQQCDQQVPIYLAMDLLAADVHQADELPTQQKNKLLFHIDEKHIRWTYDKKKLLRRARSYNAAKKRWQGTSSLMAEALAGCTFTVLQHKRAGSHRAVVVKVCSMEGVSAMTSEFYMRKGMIV